MSEARSPRTALGRLIIPLGAIAMVLGSLGCFQEAGSPTAPGSPGDGLNGVMYQSQAHLWLSIANAENTYVGEDADPWLSESWTTGAGSFDIVLTNRGNFETQNVVLLVTVPEAAIGLPGWSVDVGGVPLDLDDFGHENPYTYGFAGGSHGVFPPSGTGVFYPYRVADVLPAHGSITVHVEAWSGGSEGFRLHFDAGSTRVWSPPSHDATAEPPIGELQACCFGSECVNLIPSVCEMEGGVAMGAGTICTGETCSGGSGEINPPEDGESARPDLTN
jgi:hypothetical protein